jgi:hypothetical protein
MEELHSEHSSETNPSQQPVAEKPSVSVRKIEANRLNALKATGPKTARGKSYNRRNATKHGLLAREIVIAAPDGFAGKNEFTQLLTQLREEHGPVGVLENWQIQEIATALYMQSVVLRGQMGNFQRKLRRCDFIRVPVASGEHRPVRAHVLAS